MKSNKKITSTPSHFTNDRENNHCNPHRWFLIIGIFLLILVMAGITGCQSTSTQQENAPLETAAPGNLPTIDGATLLEERCSTCHSTDRVKQAQKNQEGWDQTVTRMIKKGAKLTEEEKNALVDFLAKTYGP